LVMRIQEKILRRRVEKFQALMKERKIDAAMIRTLSSFIYFTGTKWLRPSLLIPADGEPIAFIARGEEDGFLKRTWIKNVETYTEGGEVMAKVSGIIRSSGYKIVGLEYGIQRDAYIIFYEMFKKLNPQVNVVDVSELIYGLRMIKDDFEINFIKKARSIAKRTLEEVLPIIDKGLSETEIAAELYSRLYRYGSEDPHVYVNVGPYPRVHSEPFRDVRVSENVFVTVVIGADYNHYYANMSETTFIGRNDERAQRALKCMDEAFEVARNLTRAGIKPIDVMKELEKVYEKYGMLKYRVKGYLHGVGLQIEEIPITTIIPGHRSIELKARMAVAFIHAPLMIKDLGQVKKEYTFIINEEGELE